MTPHQAARTFLRADPLGWLAWADWLDENSPGRSDLTEKWRRRASIALPIKEVIDAGRMENWRKGVILQRYLSPTFQLGMMWCKVVLKVWTMRRLLEADDRPWHHGNDWMLNEKCWTKPRGGEAYLKKRLIEIADHVLHDMEIRDRIIRRLAP